MPDAFLRSGTCQIRSSALCSSANTVVAPINSVTVPTSAVSVLRPGSLSARSMFSMAAAPSAPISPVNSLITAPRAASAPNTMPATEITISSSGAIENTV
ncbi:hypothetical protein D3C81_1492260 [compost metagenome]